MQEISATLPDLVADIGGTNARFALVNAHRQFYAEQTLACADFPGLAAASNAFLQSVGGVRPKRAAVAVATPIAGDWIQFTNSAWSFSTEAARQELELEQLTIINDFTALALALPLLEPEERRVVGGGEVIAGEPIALIGPGTGLGVSGLIWSGKRWIPLQAEGGHATFSPVDEREWAISRILQRQFVHVSPERLLSGPGLVNIYNALAELEGWPAEALTPADITDRALAGTCEHCRDVLELFCGALGTAAGNLAITLGARGGVYIGGGIVPRLGGFFVQSTFRARFEDKGRFSSYLAAIPTWVITAANPALRGVAAALA
ncbi:MAG TPA: glucokinase [Candidatus Competibacteraceae bacterium]|nr:glucokinase [Candidatus Competibacteraceae bacterium]HRZ07492.1 glucokinase [Candidatus Competibacteraceae bacterium]HSA48227.1 glucokinase [Candidatus Competibacteraceae bacterium]